jgi:hypothetical protein
MFGTVCVFLIVLFVYIHIRYHIVPGGDDLIYELTTPSNQLLYETIYHKQPVKFTFDTPIPVDISWESILKRHPGVDISISIDGGPTSALIPARSVAAMAMDRATDPATPNAIDGVGPPTPPIACDATDPATPTMFVGNGAVMRDVGHSDEIQKFGRAIGLTPHLMTRMTYDLIGSQSMSVVSSPQSSTAHCTFLVCMTGNAVVRLCSGKYTNLIHPGTDSPYSTVSFWDPSGKDIDIMTRIRTIDTTLHVGECLAIPAHWWYALDISPNANLLHVSYKTIMNEIATLPTTIREII